VPTNRWRISFRTSSTQFRNWQGVRETLARSRKLPGRHPPRPTCHMQNTRQSSRVHKNTLPIGNFGSVQNERNTAIELTVSPNDDDNSPPRKGVSRNEGLNTPVTLRERESSFFRISRLMDSRRRGDDWFTCSLRTTLPVSIWRQQVRPGIEVACSVSPGTIGSTRKVSVYNLGFFAALRICGSRKWLKRAGIKLPFFNPADAPSLPCLLRSSFTPFKPDGTSLRGIVRARLQLGVHEKTGNSQ
jgi:hypothetical protein